MNTITKTKPLIYLVAGEASADMLGGGLMHALKQRLPGVRFAGIGGEEMSKEGLQSLFPYNELSVMGFLEVVPHIPRILRRLRETALDIYNHQPDAVITIDSPGFNFRLAQTLKNNGHTQHIKRIHYVAPSVWAYKPGRARKTAALFDGLMALLPWEPPYFEKEGLATTHVGHRVLWQEPKGDKIAFYAKHQLPSDTKLLLLSPGSRAGEVHRHLPVFLKAAQSLPDFKVMILAAPQVQTVIRSNVPAGTLVIDIAEKEDAFASAALALSKSGTITLELATAGVPTVVAHRVSPLSAWLFRRMVKIPYASLVNIAAKKEIIPELLQERCTVAAITQALHTLAKPSVMEAQHMAYNAALQILRGNSTLDPDTTAAETVCRYLEK